MKTLVTSIAIALVLGLVGFTVADLQSASAQCAASNSIKMEVMSGSLRVNQDGTFSYVLKVHWDTKATPFLGAAKKITGSIGVDAVSYVPAFFFPSSCSNGLNILVTGQKSGLGPHLVNTAVDVGPTPNNARTVIPLEIP